MLDLLFLLICSLIKSLFCGPEKSVYNSSGVSSEKEKSFREKFYFCDHFASFSHFVRSQKNAKMFTLFAKFRLNLFCEVENAKISRKCENFVNKIMRKFCEKNENCAKITKISRKIQNLKIFLWHNKTSNIELSEQRIPQVLLRN